MKRNLTFKEFYICNFIGVLIPICLCFFLGKKFIFLLILSTYFFPVVIILMYKIYLVVIRKENISKIQFTFSPHIINNFKKEV